MVYGVSDDKAIKINYSLEISSRNGNSKECLKYLSNLESKEE